MSAETMTDVSAVDASSHTSAMAETSKTVSDFMGQQIESELNVGTDDDDLGHYVVDANLRVNGVHSLRIVDASVIPVIPGCAAHATVAATASIAADIIVAESTDRKL
jgi:choline dehydrogenase-like flavoprotein